MRLTPTARVLQLLRDYESPNVTCIADDGSWPIVWDRARGTQVWDAEGKEYLDLTAAFGVMNAGHANARVVAAARRQLGRLGHAMGDVHPHALKAELACELSRLTFERWHAARSSDFRRVGEGGERGRTVFCNSGFEAVEAALKTAYLATGRPGVIAFEHGYHGLGYGALNATHRSHFRGPFLAQLGRFGHFVPFPRTIQDLDPLADSVRRLCRRHRIGAILVEPVQARGGVNVPPASCLALLRELASEQSALLALDEIYTGFGRTGAWFACEHAPVVPDLICIGKAMSGGFPISACVGRNDVMAAAWPKSNGEAIHTSTFLGHPVGCAMALAQIREIASRGLVERSRSLGLALLAQLRQLHSTSLRLEARGLGLLVGLEISRPDGRPDPRRALAIVQAMLRRGFILLPEGDAGEVLGFTPPLTVTRRQLERATRALQRAIDET